MSKKSIDYEKNFSSELSGRSAFFPNFTKEEEEAASPPPPREATVEPMPQQSAPPSEVEPTRTPRTPVRPVRVEARVRRQMVRHPFELYMDQIESLRARSEAHRRMGETGSMSQMVRQAIDAYLDANPVDD